LEPEQTTPPRLKNMAAIMQHDHRRRLIFMISPL
jgi:hypothetical protein